MKWKTKKEGAGLLELPCGFPVRFVGLIDLHVCDSESDEGENDRKDGQQDADLIEVAVDSLRPPVCGFLFDWSHMLSSARPMRYSHSFPVSFLASFFSSAVNVGSYLAAFFSRPFYP